MHKEELAYSKGYWVNKEGIVFGPKGFPLKTWHTTTDNRLVFGVRSGPKMLNVGVHRLQAYQKFKDELYKPEIVVRHKDNNYLNNSWDNILIGTQSQNMMDLPPEERLRKAKLGASKLKSLTDKEVIQLRKDRKYMTYKELISKYGLAKSTVSYIVNRKTYADIEQPN